MLYPRSVAIFTGGSKLRDPTLCLIFQVPGPSHGAKAGGGACKNPWSFFLVPDQTLVGLFFFLKCLYFGHQQNFHAKDGFSRLTDDLNYQVM